MEEDIKEGKQYCTSCGAINKKSAILCTECEEKILVRHHPFIDFLKKHFKGGVEGAATESIYTLIKKFILKYLYGAILTLSVAGVITVATVTSTPYIKTVTEAPYKEVPYKEVEASVPEEVERKEFLYLTEYDKSLVQYVVSTYDGTVLYETDFGYKYWHSDGSISPTQFWAENNIDGYTYKGKHELYTNPIPVGQDYSTEAIQACYRKWEAEGFWPAHFRYVPSEGIRIGADVKSELGQTLFANGYDVLEADYYCLTYDEKVLGDSEKYDYEALPPAEKVPYEKCVYTFLMTRKNGETDWYIAEEILAEKVGGPKFGG